MRWIVDRFEGPFAVVELDGKQMVNIPRTAIPHETKEGDIISIQIEREETEGRKEEISQRFKNLYKNNID